MQRFQNWHQNASFFMMVIGLMACLCVPLTAWAFPDKYEDDDSLAQAQLLMLNDKSPAHQSIPGYEWRQFHNFHDAGDTDWVFFYARQYDQEYAIHVTSLGANCDVVIQIYFENEQNLIRTVDNYGAGQDEYVEWLCPQDGIYYVRLYQYNPENHGRDTQYQLMLTLPYVVFDGYVYGRVMPNVKTLITTNGLGAAITADGGAYFMPHLPGKFILTAQNDGYAPYQTPIMVEQLQDLQLDIVFSQNLVIDASAGPGGQIQPAGQVPVTAGASPKFTISPDAGFVVKDVAIDGLPQGALGEHVFGSVASSHTIRASFKSAQVKPGIQTQHTDQLAVAPAGEPVCLTLQLDPGDQVGRNADWWVGFYRLAPLPNMFVSLTANGWLPQLARLFDYPLFAFKDVELPVALAQGEYLFFFAVDDNADTVLDATWFDMAQVVVK